MAPRPASPTDARPMQDPASPDFDPDQVPVEVLVKHLLAAKQSLSSMALVVRAHDLATNARRMFEESVILGAQTDFLRQGIDKQVRLLFRVRRDMGRVYDAGRRQFKQLIRTLDGANGRLEKTMAVLRATRVDRVFRPPGEDDKFLMDFVDEQSVESLRDALKASISELQVSRPRCVPSTRPAHAFSPCTGRPGVF